MVATTFRGPDQAARPTSFFSTLAAEWSKLTSLRSTYVNVLVALGLAIGLSAGITWAIGASFESQDPMAQAAFEPIMMSLFGIVFSSIMLCLVGVSFVASEYGNGMIRTTLTATPRRGRVLLAKVLIVTAVTLVIGTISAVGAFLIGQAILGSLGLPTASLSDADALRTVMGLGLTGPVFPLIGVALAVIFRSTAAAISAVLALLFTPAIFGALLPAWWQENVLRYLPDRAVDSITMGHLMTFGGSYLEPQVGALVAAVWLVFFLGTAAVLLLRRDV